MDLTLEYARACDAGDALASKRDAFELPAGVIYLDGNSLGPVPKGVEAAVLKTLRDEWGQGLIRSWNAARWIDLPQIAGDRLAPLIGAEKGSVVVADSTSVNLFKAISAALKLNPKRKILTPKYNFPTDNYIAEGVVQQIGQHHEIILMEEGQTIDELLDDDVALVMLTHVDYRDGVLHDMHDITKKAHDAGALVLFDLAHSAGAMPVALADAGVDFAVGCGYKYLNGGPGAPAFIYVAPRLQGGFRQPLSGWFAHKAPFDFTPHYQPASDISQYLCGTPPILSMVAFHEALSLWQDVDLQVLRAKSMALTDYFIALVEHRCDGHGLLLHSPREAERRGAQVAFTHKDGGYAMVSALIDRGVIGDFRAPDILRFGFAALYISYEDVWRAVDIFADILKTGAWDQEKYHKRKAVT